MFDDKVVSKLFPSNQSLFRDSHYCLITVVFSYFEKTKRNTDRYSYELPNIAHFAFKNSFRQDLSHFILVEEKIIFQVILSFF